MTEKKQRRAHHSYTDEFKQQLVLLYQNVDLCQYFGQKKLKDYEAAEKVSVWRTVFQKQNSRN